MPRIPSYLIKSRHQLFYFRVRIPTPVQTVLQDCRIEHRLSLRTGNLRQAARLAALLAARYHQFFAFVGDVVSTKKFTDRELAEYVRRHFPNGLPSSFEHEILGADGTKHRLVVDTTIPGETELYKNVLGQLVGGSITAPVIDSTVQSSVVPLKSTSNGSILFCKAIEEYDAAMAVPDPITGQYQRGFSTNDDRKERINKLRVWPWFIGDIPLSSISTDIVQTALNKLRLMPPDFKAIKGMPLEINRIAEAQQSKINQWREVVKKMPKSERIQADINAWVKLLNTRTVNNYTSVLKIFLEWAAKKQYIQGQPANGLHIPTDRGSDRTAYTRDELRVIFESTFFKTHKYTEASQYWIPHIQLLTGARSNEACQLDVSDIVQMNGVWCFRFIPDEHGTQRLKNDPSRRYVPIHSKLWNDLGLKEYHEAMKELSETGQLFPCLLYHENKQKYNVYHGKWYNGFLGKVGVKRKGLDTHSFRHTAANFFKNAHVAEPIASAILGHDIVDDDDSGKRKKKAITYEVYGGDYEIKILQKTVEMLEFGLSLSPFRMDIKRLKETSTKAYVHGKRRIAKSISKAAVMPEVDILPDDVGNMWDFDPNSIPPSV